MQFLSKSDGKSNGESDHVTASLVILKTYLNCYTPLSSEKVTKFMDLMNSSPDRRDCPGCDHMVVGFTITCAISANHH